MVSGEWEAGSGKGGGGEKGGHAPPKSAEAAKRMAMVERETRERESNSEER